MERIKNYSEYSINESVFSFFKNDKKITREDVGRLLDNDIKSWDHYGRCLWFALSHVNEYYIKDSKKEGVVTAISNWLEMLYETYPTAITDSAISKEYKLHLSSTKLGL